MRSRTCTVPVPYQPYLPHGGNEGEAPRDSPRGASNDSAYLLRNGSPWVAEPRDMGPHKRGERPMHNEVIRRRANTWEEEALPQGAINELHPHKGEHTKNRDKYQHQRNADGDHALFSSFTADVPWHALQCNRVRGGSGKEAPWEGISSGLRCGGIKRKPRLGARGFHSSRLGVGPGGVLTQ